MVQRNKINVYEDDLKIFIIQEHFVYMKISKQIKKNGLAKGGSLDNAIVVKG